MLYYKIWRNETITIDKEADVFDRDDDILQWNSESLQIAYKDDIGLPRQFLHNVSGR